ncbi:MAG: thioredoxin family protein [Candidatus Aureabacteria bacterium]|nr:thioredoxin family protein [Candidatus Auribacterota bacterium]
MKRIISSALAVIALFCFDCMAVDWQTDFAKASADAKQSGRFMLLDFSGSDWCGWCMKLEAEVFSQLAFNSYAAENLVCVAVDFPRRKAQPAELKKQNEELAGRYHIEGLPTVVILSPQGELAGVTGYQDGGAANYVEHIKEIIADYKKKT